VPRVRVTRVLIEGGRAVGVEGNALVPDPLTGEPMPDPARPGGVRIRTVVVRAAQVVVAAGALRTPAILEASGCEHPAIGRNLRIHPVTGIVAWSRDPVEVWRGPMQGARSLEFIDDAPERRGITIESAPAHAGLLALALPWEGQAAHARLMADIRYHVPLVAITRDGGSGRVSLTRAGRVRVDYRLDQIGVATLRQGLVQTARLARAFDATDILVPATRPDRWQAGSTAAANLAAGQTAERDFAAFLERLAAFDFSPNRGIVLSAHQMGSARMGSDPRRHACDPGGRVRASSRTDAVIDGLFVADSSLFPTGIGVNPMLTVMALARRVTRSILAGS
jgi:choline dehydrogenase-like flavoprotein